MPLVAGIVRHSLYLSGNQRHSRRMNISVVMNLFVPLSTPRKLKPFALLVVRQGHSRSHRFGRLMATAPKESAKRKERTKRKSRAENWYGKASLNLFDLSFQLPFGIRAMLNL